MKHSLIRTSLLGALGGAAALVAMTVARGGGGSGDATAATSPDSSMSGMMVAKDPVTGKLRMPTPEEIAALQAAGPPTKREGKGTGGALRSETLKNGAVVTTLDSSYDLYSVVAKDADGKIQSACVPGYQLDATLAAAEKIASQKEEIVDEK